MDFCLNTKTRYIMANDRYYVYHERINGEDKLYIKKRGGKHYLDSVELSDLKKAVKFFISRGSSFDSFIYDVLKV